MRVSVIVRRLTNLGIDPEEIASILEEAEEAPPVQERSKNAERQKRYRERQAVTRNVTNRNAVTPTLDRNETVTDRNESVTNRNESVTLNEKTSDIYTTTLSLKSHKRVSKEDLASRASCPENLLQPCGPVSPGKGGLGGKPKTRPKIETTAEFDRFWAVYPRRVEKRKAMKAFVAAALRADPEAIIAGAGAYARERAETDPQYTKHPTTWLNGDCWLDEPTPFVTKKTQHDKVFEKIFAEIEERKGNEVDGFADPFRRGSRRGLCGTSDFDADFELSSEGFGESGNLCKTIDYPMHGASEGDFEADG